ncbi:fibroblast growth factor 12-like isoform X2 [Rhopilema esculentum]|uniref:fibroblast growth factor 12-like isoform X2 n=1 Tax=Rhopilema esculentum TaxID=499914 RepID=UPI0031CED9E1
MLKKDVIQSIFKRQTMYDFVNEWSPEPFGLHRNNWPAHSRCLGETWKVFGQPADCLMNQDNEDENCKCTSHAKTSRRRRLRSKSGFYLTVMPNGQVLGVKDPTNAYINLDVIPVGADLVKIWGVEAELFLMIDDAGLLRATDVDSHECIFEESMTEDFCTMYYSAMYSHKRWCVGLKTRPLSTFSGALRRNKLSLRDCSFISEIVNRRSSTSSSQSCGSDGRTCSI